MEYASKGLAGTALGFGIGGAAMSLANGGLGNLLGGLGQNNRAAAAEVTAAAATPAMAALAAALASRQQEPTCSENMPVTRYDLDCHLRQRDLLSKAGRRRHHGHRDHGADSLQPDPALLQQISKRGGNRRPILKGGKLQ